MIELESPSVVLMEKIGCHGAIACLICDSKGSLDPTACNENAQHRACARRATIANQAHNDVRTS
jgi:hypothetical protein